MGLPGPYSGPSLAAHRTGSLLGVNAIHGYQRHSGCQAGVSLFAELTTVHVLCPGAGTLPMTHVMPVPSLFIVYMLPGPTLGSGAFVKTMLFCSGSQCGWM